MSHVQKASGPAVVLSESMEKLLRADFKPLSKLQVDLPDRLMSYLLTGEPATIIDELSSVKGGGNALQLTMAYHQRRGKFFRTVEVRDPQ